MKKKHVFMAIFFFTLGLVYGAVSNFILQGESASILSSFLQGLFVGMFTSAVYFMLFLFLGYCCNENFFNGTFSKTFIIYDNIISTAVIICCNTLLIIPQDKVPTTFSYAWIHIANLLFAIIVVAKASSDSKILRKKQIV